MASRCLLADNGLPEGWVLDQDQAAQSPPAGAASPQESSGVPPGWELEEDKYGTTGQQVLAGVEGLAKGVAGPLATAAEVASGLTTPEAMRARAEYNPVTHGAAEALGFGASALAGIGEARAVGLAGEGAAKLAGLGLEGAGTISKIAAAGIKTGAEMAALQTGDELSKMITQDPGQSLGTAAVNVGLSGILGGVGGAAIGSVAPLWNKTLNKLGAEKLVSDYMGETKFLTENPDLVQGAVSEINDRLAATDQMIKGGLKRNLLETLTKEIKPENIASHVDYIAKIIENAPNALKKEPLFQEAVENWKNKVLRPAEAQAITPIETVSPDYGDIPKSVLKAPRPKPERIAAMNEASGKAADANLEAANRAGFNPYESKPPEPVLAGPTEVFQATENLKRQFHEWGQYNKALVPIAERPFRDASRSFASGLKESLEDSKVWGGAAQAQRDYNKSVSPLFDIQKEFLGKFTSKEFGEKVADPTKLNTYINQAEKSKAGLKTNYVKNYLDQTQEVADALNKSYLENGLEQPLEDKLNPTPVLDHSLNTPPSAGVSLARWAKRGGAAALLGNTTAEAGASTIGGTLGFLVGHPLLGAWAGEKVLTPMFSALAKPFAEKAINTTAAKGAVDYVGSVLKGERVINKATSNFFKPGAEIIAKDLMPNVESRKTLEKSLAAMENPDVALKVGGGLNHYLPNHSTAAAATAATAVNYFRGLKPVQPQQTPLDKPLQIDKYKQATYDRQLDIAQQPLLALHYAKKGQLQAQDVQTLNTLYPGVHSKIVAQTYDQLAKAKADGSRIPYSQRKSLSILMGTPLDSTLTQRGMASIAAANGALLADQQARQPQAKVSKSTATTQSKLNKMYATPDQARSAKRTTE